MQAVSGKITQDRFTKGLRVCRLPVFAGSIGAALLGLPCKVSMDGIEAVKVCPWATAAIRTSSR